MKAGNDHRVCRFALRDHALTILRELEPDTEEAEQPTEPERRGSQFAFEGSKAGRPLSNMAFLMLLRRI